MKRFALTGSSAFWLAALGLILADGWIAWTCWVQWDQAQHAAAQLVHLERLAQKIETLRRSPVQVEEGARTGDALARLIETAAKQVNLNPDQIVGIDPGEPRRLEKSPYLEQKTSVELREIPLQKIVEFSMTLERSGMGMDVSTLSLRVPAGTDVPISNEELWNAQLILTCRIFEARILAPSPSPSPSAFP